MSAFAAIVRLDEEPVPRPLFERMHGALDHRGCDGKNIVWRSSAGRWSAALGTQHFWTTPEERGDIQPASHPESGIDLLFDGRLDNRGELLAALRPTAAAMVATSDARLALAAFLVWDRRCFERLLGPFAMVAVDRRRRRVVCGRDALGGRTLYYHLAGSGRPAGELVVASEVEPVLRHPAVSSRLDEVSVARFFAVEAPLPGATFFADVRELPPGHTLILEDDCLRLERHWSPDDLSPVRYRRDGEYVERFRELLAASVRCRMRSPSPPAVLMSGGLDSTSVAALAARELERSSPGCVGGETRLRTISWVFKELPAADERQWIDPMVEHFGLDACPLPADGEWPLRDLDSWPVPADAPWQGLYRRLQDRAYATARQAGSRVLLSGEFGDHLYDGEAFWLRDLVSEGRRAEAWRGIRRELAGRPLWTVLRPSPVRSAVLRLFGWRGRRRPAPEWLTPYARRRVDRLPGRRSPNALNPLAAHAVSLEVAVASRAGVEVRSPYRDRRLVELMLSIPAHLVYRPDAPDHAGSKWILRRAMAGILPEKVRLRRHVSTLLPLAARGLVEREAATVGRFLDDPAADWRRYVRADWLQRAFPHRLAAGLDGVESLIPWQCLCNELWNGRSERSGKVELCRNET